MRQDTYRDPSLPVEERVADLLSRLTLAEKAGQLTQYFWFGAFGGGQDAAAGTDAMPLDAQAFREQPRMVEAAIAAGNAGAALFVKDPASANRLQRIAIEGSRHGIPLLFGFDVIHGFRTIFPVPIAQAASWDPDVIEAGQRVAAREARASGIHWAFAPMVDIARDPRWGRIIEGAGEDPFLGGAVAAAQVGASRATSAPRASSPGPSTSPATVPHSADGTTTTPTSPTASCGTATFRRSGPRSRRGPRTSWARTWT